jgi:hypothetical protein
MAKTPEQQKFIMDLACVLYFLHGAREEMFNSHTGREALAAFCRLQGMNEAAVVLRLSGFTKAS